MANTKNAQLRYRILDKCFRKYNCPCTFTQLKEEVERVFRDLIDDHFKLSERTLCARRSMFSQFGRQNSVS